MITALESYGQPESSIYLKMIQEALRRLLPDEGVDLGLPGDEGAVPLASEKKDEDSSDNTMIEDMILAYLDEHEGDSRGVFIEDLVRRLEENGISAQKTEEIYNKLMDDGLIYEPNLGYLKKI